MKPSLISLGDVCEVQNGYAFDSKYFSSEPGSGMPLIRIRDILNGFTNTYFTSDYSEEYVVKKGDFLIGMDGDFNIGQWKSEDALLNQRVCRLLPTNRILPKFIYYYIPAALQAINASTSYTTVKHLSSKQVKAILIPALTVSEQQHVVDVLDAEFARIDELRNNAEKSLQNAKDLYQAVLSKELELTENKQSIVLDDVCSFRRGLTYSKADEASFSSKGVLRSNNVDLRTNSLNLDDIKYLREDFSVPEDKIVKKNSILICMSNGSKSHLGKVALIEDDMSFAFGGFMGLLVPRESIVDPAFFYYSLSSKRYKDFIRHLSDGAGINNLKYSDLKQFILYLPQLREQKNIVQKLISLSKDIIYLQSNNQRTLTLCDDLKQALLRKAFNGEL